MRTMIDNAARFPEKYDFDFRRTCRFGTDLQDVLSAITIGSKIYEIFNTH